MLLSATNSVIILQFNSEVGFRYKSRVRQFSFISKADGKWLKFARVGRNLRESSIS